VVGCEGGKVRRVYDTIGFLRVKTIEPTLVDGGESVTMETDGVLHRGW
jgi:hypothetical protein